jgi:hypothetical protein
MVNDMTENTYQVGDLIRFPEDRRPYRVRARSDRYLICTKPFNLFHTVLYTIVDFERQERGPGDKIFNGPYETDVDCAARMAELSSGQLGVSRRHGIPLVLS